MNLAPCVDIDLDAAGKSHGRIVFPLQTPWEGRNNLTLPACVIANGSGPSVTLWGGNHGNEWEGPLVLAQMVRELDPGAIEGRLIILPNVNPAAVAAQSRESPVDGANMNRIWPGDPEGTISERIVAWLDTEILPRADALMDLHTGGDVMDLVPMSMCHHSEDPEFAARIHAAQLAFNAPLSVELRLGPGRPTASHRAHERGVLVVGSESGGGRAVSPRSLANCYEGVRNTLDHLGVLAAPPAPGRRRYRTRFTRKWGHEAELSVDEPGVFVPFHRLWDTVEEGQPAGQFFRLDAPREPPRTLVFPASGLIAGRRARSGVRPGDVLYWIVRDIDGAGLGLDSRGGGRHAKLSDDQTNPRGRA